MSRINLHAFIVATGLGATCLAMGLAPGTAVATALDEAVMFDIPAQPLEGALLRFSQQAGIQLMTSSDELPATLSSAVTGRQPIGVALETLLRGTGLTFSVVKDGTIAVRSGNARATTDTVLSGHGMMRLAQADTGAGTAVPAAAFSGYAQAESESGSMLDTVTVTGSRMRKQLSDVTTSISVVDEKALAEQFSISTDVLDALNVTVPGLNVSQGYGRQGCNMNVRGRQANFQINGIPVNQDLRESNCNAMYQVSPFALERIEVLRGASALYGAGAPGGTINLITRRAASETLEVDGTFRVSANPRGVSDTQSFDVYLGAGQTFEAWDYYAGLAYQDIGAARTPTDTFVPQEELTSWSFNGSLGRKIGDGGQLRITGTLYREERGQEYAADATQSHGSFGNVVPIDSHPFKGEGHDQLFTLMASYEQEQVLGHTLAVSAYLQSQEYIQRANDYGVPWGGNFFYSTDAENDRIGFRSTLARDFAVGGNTLELEYGIDYVSNTFYRPWVDALNGGVITGWVSPELTLDTTSGFLQSDYVVGRLRVSGGIRYEEYAGEVGDRGYDPSLSDASTPGKTDTTDLWLANIGAVFDLTDTLQLYGGFSQGAELSQLARAIRGQPDPSIVSPEPATSDQYEIGVRGKSGSVEYSAAAFYSESDKASLLQADASCVGQPLCPLIPLRTPQRFHGIEGTLDWNASDRLTTGAIFTMQKGEIFDLVQQRYVEYSAQHVSPLRLTGYAALSPTAKMQLRLQGTYYGAADYYSAGDEALGLYNTDSLFLMDFSSSYGIGPGELTVSVANLLDKEYVNIANQASFGFFYYMEEGRRVSLGYRVRF